MNFGNYRLRESVLTKNEMAFYGTLKEVINDKLIILSMVRLADIFYIDRGEGSLATLNRINSRHVDFLLCQKDTLRPMVAIELDDKSHRRADRIKRDDFVNKLFASVGLPLLRYQSKYRYTPNDLTSKLEPYVVGLDADKIKYGRS